MVKQVIGCKFKKECEAENITESPFLCCAHCSIQGRCPNESQQCNEVPDTCCGVIAIEILGHEPIDIKEAIKIYDKHNEDCDCNICKRVKLWYQNNRQPTCCMPELMREMRFGN